MRNLVLIINDTYQRETLSEGPIRQPLKFGGGDDDDEKTDCPMLASPMDFHQSKMLVDFCFRYFHLILQKKVY